MMEEWQRRQREEKEKERRQKQATAELLSGYRASELSQDDVKLKALREEERRRKLEAEQTLRNFKKLEEPGIKTRTAAAQPSVPLPVNAGGSSSEHHAGNNITFGSVSAMKANFDDSFSRSNNNDDPSKLTEMSMPWGSNTPTEAPPTDAATIPEPSLDTSAAETTGAPVSHGAVVDLNGFDAAPVDNGFTQQINPPLDNGTAETPDAFGITDNQDTIMPTTSETNFAPAPPPSQQPESTQPLKVFFKFGIITDHATADDTWLGPYRQAILAVLQPQINALAMDDIIMEHYTRDDTFVDSYQRPQVQRFVATASVRIRDVTSDLARDTRKQVWNAVGQAIQSGQLLQRL